MRIHPSPPRLRLLALLTPFALMASGLSACKTPSSGEQAVGTVAPDSGITDCSGDVPQITIHDCTYGVSGPGTSVSLETDTATVNTSPGSWIRVINKSIYSSHLPVGLQLNEQKPLLLTNPKLDAKVGTACVQINEAARGKYPLINRRESCKPQEGTAGSLEVVVSSPPTEEKP